MPITENVDNYVKVGPATKAVYTDGRIVYRWPSGKITINDQKITINNLALSSKDDPTEIIINYPDVIDKYGSSIPEELVDYWLNNDFFLSGNLAQVPSELAGLNLTSEQIRGILRRYCLGHNIAVDNSTLQDMTTFGEDYITQPTVLTQMQVVSDSVEDDAGGGTGAFQITIHGLDALYNRKTQIVDTNGTSAVIVDVLGEDIEFLAINHVGVSGTSPTNIQHTAVGNITIETITTGAIVYGKIDAGGNMELATRLTVPLGFTAYISAWNASVGELPNQGDEVLILLRGTLDSQNRTLLDNIFIFQDVIHLAENAHQNIISPVLDFPEKCQIKVSSKLNGGGGSVVLSASFQYWLVPNI